MLKNFLVNWRTTAAGVAAILGGGGAIISNLLSGHIDPNLLWAQGGIVAAGVAGVFAKDHNVTGAGATAKAK